MFCNNCGKEFKEALPVCDNCGAPLTVPNTSKEYAQAPVTPPSPPAAPAPQKPKKKSGKYILIAVIAVVLVAAIVCGIIFIPKHINKDGEGETETTAAVNTGSVYDSAPETPQGETFEALTTTVFDSKEIDISVVSEGETLFSVDIDFGDSLATTTAVIVINYYGEDLTYTLKDSTITAEFQGETVEASLDDFIQSSGLQTMIDGVKEEYGIDVFTVLDTVLNGCINFDEVSKFISGDIYELIKEELLDEYGVTLEIPQFGEIFNYVADFIDTGISEEALSFEKVEGDNGTTYKFSANPAELVRDLGEYIKTEQELKDMIQVYLDYEESDVDVNEFIDEVAEELADDIDYIGTQSASVTINNGRITNVTIMDDADVLFDISISSK